MTKLKGKTEKKNGILCRIDFLGKLKASVLLEKYSFYFDILVR
jgi:hypothetical protein